jgi:hypothetical protein
LRNRPPSAFNIPDNAPPSPPSDQSNERRPTAPSSSKQEQASTATKLSAKDKVSTDHDYSVNELKGLFSKEDWLELYAFVDLIDSLKTSENYDSSWSDWAEAQGDRTAEQWRQYFDKVVRPQWLSDPVSKRENIKRQILEKHGEETLSQSQSISQQFSQKDKTSKQPPGFDDEHFEALISDKQNNKIPAGYKFYAREEKKATLDAQPSRGSSKCVWIELQCNDR